VVVAKGSAVLGWVNNVTFCNLIATHVEAAVEVFWLGSWFWDAAEVCEVGGIVLVEATLSAGS
jgi:hypothetical protein